MADEHGSSGEDSYLGMTVLGQYRILRELAKGGMSSIYLAEQLGMDRHAALKIIRPVHLTSEEVHRRFEREARTASRLKHPQIVTVYNFGELADGSLFIAMEYVEGIRLSSALAHGALPVRRAIELARQFASALAYAHGLQIVHRDFKPDNAMLTECGGVDQVKILDFGIARVATDVTMTRAGHLMGTPRYMSPEQCRGEIATAQSDQYALGLVLYEMVAGTPAVDADSPLGFLHLHQSFVPPPCSSLARDPAAAVLDELLAKMLAKRPADRCQDLAEVGRALERALATLPAEPASPPLCRLTAALEGMPTSGAISSLPLCGHDSWSSSGSRPVRICSLASQPLLSDEGWQALRARGFLQEKDPSAARLFLSDGELAAEPPPDAARTLQLHDRALERAGGLQPEGCFVVGPAPFHPSVISLALSWLHGQDRSDGLISQELPMVEISSSLRRAICVDRVLAAARGEGLRQAAVQALAEVCEEMISNALFHAPVDAAGNPRSSELERSSGVELPPGDEATLSWCFLRHHVLVSVRDPFGSLRREQVVDRLLGPPRAIRSSRGGAGMGLRTILRASSHLLFAVRPGYLGEVLAILPRQPGPDEQSGGKSVGFLEAGGTVARLGSGLRLHERREQGVLHLQLIGEISESCDLRPVFAREGVVRVDLKRITRFTSHGVRLWLEALELRPLGQVLELGRCSLAVVNQLNMVPTMAEGLRVLSVLIPHYCGRCGAETLELVSVATGEALLAERACPRCGAILSLDGIRDQYFTFLDTTPRTTA